MITHVLMRSDIAKILSLPFTCLPSAQDEERNISRAINRYIFVSAVPRLVIDSALT